MILVYPNQEKPLLFQTAITATNDTLGPEGLVPLSLVFGELPRVYTASGTQQPRDTLSERATMAHAARTEMHRVMAKMLVARGLRHSFPLAAGPVYGPGDQVFVWCEKVVNHRLGE